MAHTIELILTPELYPLRSTTTPHTTVAVDILRATTSICAAFKSGIESIVPLDSLEPIPHYRQLGYLIAAERMGVKIDNAECGNSPLDYLQRDLHGEKLAYSSTNGTVCILRGSDSEQTLIGCFSNISALENQLAKTPQDIVILCSGWKGDFSLEDTIFAGELADRLQKDGRHIVSNDATSMAIDLFQQAQPNLYDYCRKATHVQRLQRLGCDGDIRYAFKHDTFSGVPRLNNDKIIVL